MGREKLNINQDVVYNLNLPKTCPRCPDITATSFEEVDEMFGFRKGKISEDGTQMYYPQSYSRKGRREAHAEMLAARRAEAASEEATS